MLFEIKVRYTKQTGEENPKIVKEVYVIEGESFGDAESTLLQILIPESFGNDIDIVAMKKVAPFDIVDCVAPEKVFKCKCVLIISDGEEESRKPIFLYVGASDLELARKAASQYLKSYDSELLSVEETKIVDVYRR